MIAQAIRVRVSDLADYDAASAQGTLLPLVGVIAFVLLRRRLTDGISESGAPAATGPRDGDGLRIERMPEAVARSLHPVFHALSEVLTRLRLPALYAAMGFCLRYLVAPMVVVVVLAFSDAAQGRVEAVSFRDRDGRAVALETDGVIVSGRFRPEAALLSDSHLDRDPGTGGPVIDQFGRCSDPSYFAAGNLLRAAETSGWCWREGVDTARRIVADIAENGAQPAYAAPLPIRFSHPALRFVVPQRIAPGGAGGAMVQMQLGLDRPFSGRLVARSAGKVLWAGRLSGAAVRRVLAPLAPILNARPGAPVDLGLE